MAGVAGIAPSGSSIYTGIGTADPYSQQRPVCVVVDATLSPACQTTDLLHLFSCLFSRGRSGGVAVNEVR